MIFSPTAEQRAIFGYMADPDSGHLIIEARAGAGKTSTMEEALNHAPEAMTGSVLVCAFNKDIVGEFRKRVKRSGRGDRVKTMTLHGFGLRFLRAASGQDVIPRDGHDFEIARTITDRMWGGAFPTPRNGGHRVPSMLARAVATIASWGKNTLTVDAKALLEAAAEHDMFPKNLPRYAQLTREQMVETALESMRDAIRLFRIGSNDVSHDDCIFLPWALDLQCPGMQKDLVIVDEGQDLNEAQKDLIKRVCRGRIVVVGDPKQAIYEWRGATEAALEKMAIELEATTLPLTVTFRCPRRVVDAANTLVSDFQPRPGAPLGLVECIHPSELASQASEGAFVIARTNAWAVRACLALIKANLKATVLGRDIGKALISRIHDVYPPGEGGKRWTKVLVRKLKAHLDRERMFLEQMGRFEAIRSRTDEVDAITVLCEGHQYVEDVEKRISKTFSEGRAQGRIVCMTAHKSKGLEADTVFLMDESFGQSPHANIDYVAMTRAKRRLVFCGSRQGHFELQMNAAGVPRKGDQTSHERDQMRLNAAVESLPLFNVA
ncbi:MAG: UvrD-helicase domain-containing protein [Bradymonadia bacterium]